ncbi:MAG: hypothetical protein QOG68_2168, partial [Solirubrobacteraceae bacterium]|nr:hypothetical protein [Solirubrobacteraceae bacterium]
MSAQATQAPSPRLPRALAVRLPVLESDWFYASLLGAALAWVAVRANGGLQLSDTTTVEIALDLMAGAVAAVALLVVSAWRRNLAGTVAAAFFGLFVVASAVSTIWSVAPDQSWIEANRLVTYLAVFGMGIAFVRLAPHRWAVVLGAITIASVAVSIWALLHKVFPGWLEPDEIYARLREPFGYWNAVGLMAALGVPGCLWLGARRTGHPVVNALATPAIALLLVVILLAYSRGALLALFIGCVFWFSVVPLRLRAFSVLAPAVVGAGLVIAWVFGQDALSKDKVPLTLRDEVGHQLLIAVVFMALVLLAVGMAIGFARERRTLSPVGRRRAGIAVLVAVALIPLAGVAKLAVSDRGLGGSVSHAFHQLTDVHGGVDNTPGRLTAVGSVRAKYWNDALKIFKEHPIAGVGVGGFQIARLRIRDDQLEVLHAHGYVVQTLADRGIIGLLLSLAALVSLAWAVSRATGLRRRGKALRTTPERVGLLTLTAIVIVFGVHSLIDWTWFIPGVAIPALLAGGWLAGRGALEWPPRAPDRLTARLRAGVASRGRLLAAAGAVALAGSAAWAAWQPQRSIDAGNDALDALDASPPQIQAARKLAKSAEQRDPLSIQPYFDQAAIETKAHDNPGARRALEAAIRLQPANPETWIALAD